MGCDSPDSNFKAEHYDPKDGRWWCTSGFYYSVAAPTKEMVIERIGQPYCVMMLHLIQDGKWHAGWYIAEEVEGTKLPPGIYEGPLGAGATSR